MLAAMGMYTECTSVGSYDCMLSVLGLRDWSDVFIAMDVC